MATNIFNSSAVEYADTAPDAYVVLEPVYVPDENAKTFPVTVMIYSPDHPSGDSVGITVNRGSVLTADTVKTYPEVSEKISDLEEKGYLLDPTTSTDSLTVDSADKVFTLYYADEPVTLNAQFVSGSVPGGTINVDGYSTEPSASLTILGAVGSEVTFDITTPAGYAIDTITVNSEEQTVPQRVDGSYAFVYTVDHSDLTAGTRQIDILVSLKADPDAWATITFKTDEHGAFTDEESQVIVKVLKGSEFPDAPTPVESIPDEEGGQWLFDSWDQAFPTTVTDNGTYTAIYKFDSNKDGVPDEYQITVTFDLDDLSNARYNATLEISNRMRQQSSWTIRQVLLPSGSPREATSILQHREWTLTMRQKATRSTAGTALIRSMPEVSL